MKKFILFSLSLLLFIPFVANASLDTNLYYGLQQNSDVKQLQEFLIDKGYLSGNSTGNFFSLTLNAVKQYQKSQKISQTGYVGTLTRQAINTELVANLQGSNQESVSETGTTPPTPTPLATTNDLMATLQAQIALLTQQLQVMLAQQATTQQIQQNTQQIVQNTTPPACTPNWQCGSWNTCTNSQQTRTCSDANNCGVTTGQTILTQSCTPPTSTLSISCLANSSSVQTNQSVTFSSSVAILGGTGTYIYSWTGDCAGHNANCSTSFSQAGTKTANLTVNYGGQTQATSCSTTVSCTPNWQCSSWNACSNYQQARTCNDSNNCGVVAGEPALTQSCVPTPVCTPNWQCGTWGTCVNSQQIRTCNDSNNCNTVNGKPTLTQSCSTPIISTDDTLSSLNVNGILVPNFSSTIFSLNYLLPAGTTTIPVVTATTNNANAIETINQATSTTGTATVLVTAQDGINKQTYTINFSVAINTLVIQGTTLDYPGSRATYAWGISGNNIVGYYSGSGANHGFLYNGATWTSIDYPGAIGTFAQGVSGNNIVGWYFSDSSMKAHGFLYDGTNWTTLDGPGSNTYLYGIDGNNIVGSSNSDGFLYNITTKSWTIIDYPGASNTYPHNISGNNIVGSYMGGGTQGNHSFIYNGTTWTSIDYPGAVIGTTGIWGISGNNIIGNYNGDSGAQSFLYNGTTWTTFKMTGAIQTDAQSISGNNIVGFYADASSTHGFLYAIQ